MYVSCKKKIILCNLKCWYNNNIRIHPRPIPYIIIPWKKITPSSQYLPSSRLEHWKGRLRILPQPVRLLYHSPICRGPKSAWGGIQDGGYSREEPGRPTPKPKAAHRQMKAAIYNYNYGPGGTVSTLQSILPQRESSNCAYYYWQSCITIILRPKKNLSIHYYGCDIAIYYYYYVIILLLHNYNS